MEPRLSRLPCRALAAGATALVVALPAAPAAAAVKNPANNISAAVNTVPGPAPMNWLVGAAAPAVAALEGRASRGATRARPRPVVKSGRQSSPLRFTPPASSSRKPARRTRARQTTSTPGRLAAALAFARRQLGDRYRAGGAGPDAWDCSGLMQASYRRAGRRLPRRAAAQSTMGRRVSPAAARPGDLVYWGGRGSAYHVGIYAGGGRVIHAARPGVDVVEQRIWGRPGYARL